MCEECGCPPAPGAAGRKHGHSHGHGHGHHHGHGDHEHPHEHEHEHEHGHTHGHEDAARHNREHFAEHGVLAVSLIGSPGSGKTALLEATARAGRRPFGVIAADIATDADTQRLRAAGVPSVGVATGAAWHLDAEHVHDALHDVPLRDLSYLFVENVGDLIAPAVRDLGQTVNVVVLSVAEGDDKPLKFPVTFRKADLVLLTKIDLLPQLPEVRVEAIEKALARLMPLPALIPVSARTGEGIDRWLAWLEVRRDALRRD